jgi:hypothetical protein
MRRLMSTLLFAALCLSSVPVAAAETSESAFAVTSAPVIAQRGPAAPARDYHLKRPAALPALYATFGALQAWDLYTTSAALGNGAREANPLMKPLAGHSARAIAFKAATTASTIFFAERLWKQNRVAAVVVLAAINGATTAVAMNNMRNARRGR